MCVVEGSGKERSAETGQEGLEDVPDYQESLRQYTLGLGGKESSASPSQKEGGGGEDKPTSQKENHMDQKRKRKASDHAPSLQQDPPPPPPHMMPNGYPMPPYPMPPYHHPTHMHPHLPPEERRNGAGFPSDAFFPPPPNGPYRMPGYPPHPNMPKPGQ